MDVSIIIVNYNTITLMLDAINSILDKVEEIDYEIIVIDNNSTDNSKEILAEKYGDKVTYLGLAENIGFGRANNEAAKIATGRNLFFLNPDTVLLNNAVKILSDYLDNNPNVGCCGGNLYDADMNPAMSFYRFSPKIFQEIDTFLEGIPGKILYGRNSKFNNKSKPLTVAWIMGADLMVKKKIFDMVQGFDPAFFMCWEEIELQYRINKEGYKIISVPYAQIIHLEGKSYSKKTDRATMFMASKKICIHKTNGPIAIGIIYVLVFLGILSRIFIWHILRNREKVAWWKAAYKSFVAF